MSVKPVCITGKPVLTANLRKLARPIGQHERPPLVIQVGVKCAIRLINPASHKPTAGKLEITGGIEAESTLESGCSVSRTGNRLACEQRRLVLLAPNELATCDERFVNGTPQWFPMVGCVDAVKIGDEVAAKQVVPARARNPQIQVAVVRPVSVAAQVPYDTQV